MTERSMTKSQQKPALSGRVWNAPRLVRIGTIADVAGAPAGATQNATKS